MYQHIEAASAQAWPSIEESYIGPFLLRCAGGFTKRANSALLVENNTDTPQPASFFTEQVAPVEHWYQARSLPAIFRLTEFSPTLFDTILEQRGYQAVEPTLVMQCTPQEYLQKMFPVPERKGVLAGSIDADLWLEVEAGFSNRKPQELQMMRNIMERNRGCNDHFVVRCEGMPVACGLGVHTGKEYAIFCVYTAPQYRRMGFGKIMIAKMLERAAAQGAQTAWLQVLKRNQGAQALYRRMGFSELYTYWYRVQSHH